MTIVLVHTEHTRRSCTLHGPPHVNWWYTYGSKFHGKAGGGIKNGRFRAAFHVHGRHQAYRAETMACAVASHQAQPREEVILDKQGVVKATPSPFLVNGPTKWTPVEEIVNDRVCN